MAEKNTMHLTVSSVSENLFDGQAFSVTLPGIEGDFTVLPNHEPFVTTLKAGKVVVRVQDEKTQEFSIESGVLETSGTRTVVLV